MMKTRRHIFTDDAKFAITPAADGKPAVLTGYALVWNVLSTDRGGYQVKLAPKSARFATPTHALRHHDWKDVIGCTTNGTLRLLPDDYGVKVEIDLPDTTVGRDLAVSIQRGDIRGMSFSMVDRPTATETTENGKTIVYATDFLVDEVTVTAIPSFVEAQVEVKPPSNPSYATRRAHALKLQKYQLDQMRL